MMLDTGQCTGFSSLKSFIMEIKIGFNYACIANSGWFASSSVGSMFPGLGHLLLLRLNPISLLALGQSLSVLTAKLFIDFE